ncbi:uncharacterized protein LY79DRAFT_588630 [Colletotrichum navitas]|uniref:Uncharacterized protein n=1 Tax=Colletotrichum navitas TaxID=681940 RepID=A0AAD8Q4Z7_9PEZI|nr:uncharacterized protein LY79DRAFT_588630 [Colletotrichum navitas]KAK1595197.1 hypothetical protein LY79DRAFT_588630 [Colletotrichum navitas]
MSVLGALSAMAMISQDFGDVASSRVTGRGSRTQRIVLQILYQALRLVRSQHASREAVSPLLLAIFFTSFPGPAHDSAIQLKAIIDTLEGGLGQRQNLGGGRRGSQILDIAVALTCSVAHCCGRATSRPSSQYFAELCRLVDRLGVQCFARLRADGAFFLAQKTDDLRDLVFAETLTRALTSKDHSVDANSGSEETFAGFRWEEGISEWIAVSPVARRRNGIVPAQFVVPRRSSRHRYGSFGDQRDHSELDMTAGAAEEIRPLMAMAKAASEPDGIQVDRRQAGKRPRGEKHDHGSQSREARATTEGIDELSMCQENRPRTLGKSQLRNHTMARLRNQCRRATRSGETGPRMVLAELCGRANPTGHGDEDELGF